MDFPPKNEYGPSGRLKGRPRLYLVLLVCFTLAWGFGQISRDLNRVTSLFFFLPTPICAGLLCAYAASVWKGGWRKIAIGTAMAALVPLLLLLFVENRWPLVSQAQPRSGTTRLVHWNVGWGQGGWKKIYHEIADQDPDLVLLSEVPDHMEVKIMADSFGGIVPESGGSFQERDNDYESLGFSPMVILARGALNHGRWLLRKGTHKVYAVDWIFEGRTHTLFAVELNASLLVKRNLFLGEVIDLVAREKPDLVVGDFNAPRRSRALSDLPAGYVHAYDVAGGGWSYTWPFPVYLYAIDQCIIGPRIKPVDYDLRSSTASDHRMQVLDFTLNSD